jgi:FMN reductase
MRIAIVVGNPKANSRTLGVAQSVARAVASALPGESDQLVVDLADYGGEMFDWSSTTLGALNQQVADSDVLVVASPTYKASYTGLLKAFLDRYGNDGLAGTIAVPVMTGAAPIHALTPEFHLRPLLVELGASVPTRGLYVTEDQLGALEATVAEWGVAALPVLRRALG